MLLIISPAKKLDFAAQGITQQHTIPDGLERSAQLIGALRKLSAKKIAGLMDLSDDLAQLNHSRYAAWSPDFTQGELKQALLAFKGDVYQGMDADSMGEADLLFGQRHLRILSGLHGLLRPLDLIKPYRLEMGTKLAVGSKKDLYAFWGNIIAERLQAALDASGSPTLVNLASAEYFKAAKPKALKASIIHMHFKDWKNGQLKPLFLYVKQARGMMAGFAIRQRITDAEQLKAFDGGGYRYTEGLSTDTDWVFTR